MHGDLQAKNILIGGPKAIGVFGWENALTYGPPGLDLLFLAVTARAPSRFTAAVRALMKGHEPEGTPVIGRLCDAGLDAAAAKAALIVSANIWAANEHARRSRLGAPSEHARFESLLGGFIPGLN